MHLPLVSDGWR